MPEVIIIPPSSEFEIPKTKVCAYCRVSSDSEDQAHSFINQTDYFTNLIAENENWELVDIYADDAVSGTKLHEREEFCRMMRDCRKRKIDRVLVKSISRFSRNAKDCLNAVRELKMLDIAIYFEQENIDTSELTGEMLISVFGSIAQEESLSMSGNQRWSYIKRMQSGEFITCKAPYGYRLINATLVPQEDEAAIVREIYDSYLKGKGIKEIAAELTSRNIPKRESPNMWYSSTAVRILRNERYCGDALLQKKYSTNTIPFKKVRNHGERDQYYVENSHEPIVSKETFQTVQALIKSRQPQKSKAPHITYSLSKKITCGVCGKKYKRRVSKNGEVFWVCDTHDRGKNDCPAICLYESQIETAFITLITTLKYNAQHILSPIIADFKTMQDYTGRNNTRIGEINKEIAALTEQNHAYSKLQAKGYMDSALFISKSGEINKRIANLRQLRRQIIDDDSDDTVEKTVELIETLAAVESITMTEDLLASTVSAITADGNGNITFKLINGLEITERVR